MMATLSLNALTKTYDGRQAVDDVTLAVAPGEFFSILGPSGCGKTTLLRLIAGFEEPTSGTILLDGLNVAGRPPQERGIGMVFQNYALFPHMNVFENVAYSLRIRRMSAAEIARRVDRVLQAVHLGGKQHSPVPTLSGGEQQRVAVARALAMEPALLLFDEPLSNLDVALRLQTREEIRGLQRSTGITALYVTHDQSEAMSLSDRIAVMRAGRIEQVGTPAEVYTAPANPFVAAFLGGANLVEGAIARNRLHVLLHGMSCELPIDERYARPGRLIAAIKPEAILLRFGAEQDGVEGRIEEREYLGHTTAFVVSIGGVRFRAVTESTAVTTRVQRGDAVRCSIDWSRCTIFLA